MIELYCFYPHFLNHLAKHVTHLKFNKHVHFPKFNELYK